MPLPPGLNGYVLGQQQQSQNQAQQLQGLLGLLSAQSQMADQGMRQQLFPLQLQEHQAKIKAAQDQEAFSAMLRPLLGGDISKIPPDVLDAIGVHASLMNRPGAATIMSIADKRRQQADNAAAVQSMQSSPGVTPVTPNDDDGNPNPVIPARPGLLSPLTNSPFVGQSAQALQGLINQGAPGITPQQITSHMDRLQQMHNSMQNSADTRQAIADRQQNSQQFKIDFRGMYPPQDKESSPYTNVQSDGKGGFVGLNKKTLRMEPIQMAPGIGPQTANPDAPKLSGDAYLASLPAETAALVKSVAEGRTSVKDLSTRGGHRENVISMANQYKPGFDSVANNAIGTALAALERQRANVMTYEKTALAGADIALEMSSKVDRSGIPLVNKWVNAGRVAIAGDTDVSRLNNAVETFANEYAKVMSGSSGGQATTVSMQEHARKMLNGAMTPQQFSGVIDLMKREMTQTREKAFDAQIEEMRTRRRTGETTVTAPGAAPGGKTVVRRGVYGGKSVIQYNDGSVEYAK